VSRYDEYLLTPAPGHSLAQPLANRDILRLYWPLALSWLFMSIETPTAIWVISRMADAKENTAGYLIMSSLAIWIESPVIDLLATSTTLAKSRAGLSIIRRFASWMILWVTLAHTLVSCTPVYDWLMGSVIGLPPDMLEKIRVPFILMIPWSGFIGWRRYLQGLMIGAGQTRAISVGTFVRFGTMLGVGVGLYMLQGTLPLSGLAVAAIALVCSVAAESLFISFASRDAVSSLSRLSDDGSKPVTLRKVVSFHMPLTIATMVMMLSTPAVGAALARTPDSVQSLAAWQVAITLLGLLRAVTFALNEVVIALNRDEAGRRALMRFCLATGASLTMAAAALHVTGIDYWVFHAFLRAKPDVAELARHALLASCLIPTINAMMVYYRGLLTSIHETVARMRAIFAGIGVLVFCLVWSVSMRWPGIYVAAFALTTGMLVELVTLALSWRVSINRRSKGLKGHGQQPLHGFSSE